MPYANSFTLLDFDSRGVSDVRVSLWYTFTVVGGPVVFDDRQEEAHFDFPSAQLGPARTFSIAGNLAPTPIPNVWFTALSIQEIPRIAADAGWLFRSGRYTADLPTDPIEVIVAPEQLIGAAELAGAVGTLPLTDGGTTVTSLSLMVSGADIALTATGTNTGLPAGVTFTFTGTLALLPNDSLRFTDEPLFVRLENPTIAFTAAPGTGFVTFLLNVVRNIILGNVVPTVQQVLRSRLNAGILSDIASRLSMATLTTLPAGVVLSIRSVAAKTRPLGAGTEPVIAFRGALGAFGGVGNKFPPGPGSTCFIATAAVGTDAPELAVLRTLRDEWLRSRRGGEVAVRWYERWSPAAARVIAASPVLRVLTRVLVVRTATALARLLCRH
jgi:hypothetical protein